MIANYHRVYTMVRDVLQRYSSDRIPISLKYITRQLKDLKICSYSAAIAGQNCTMKEWIEYMGSDLGACVYIPARQSSVIYYNDTKSYKKLDRFTIAHELGHFFLEHHKLMRNPAGIIQRGLDDKEYSEIEKEANCFARNLLAPAPIILRLDINPSDINAMCNTFDISRRAAKTRDGCFVMDENCACWSKILDNRFHNSILLIKSTKTCQRCGYHIMIDGATHCPMCGSKNIRLWGNENQMRYSGLDVMDNGKAKQCPICGNEETNIEGKYCQICGTHIINMCQREHESRYETYLAPCCEAAEALPGNARYCPFCGAKTTFLIGRVLKPWNENQFGGNEEHIDGLPF